MFFTIKEQEPLSERLFIRKLYANVNTMIKFNPNSTAHISALFFGAELKDEEIHPDRDELGNHNKYKSGQKKGQLKYKNVKVIRTIKGLGLKPNPIYETKKEGIYKTDEAVLKLIALKKNHDAGKIATLMLNIRYLNKQISTYYESTEKVVHDFDSCIHPELCHFGYDKGGTDNLGGGVATGRLSSRNPNILNQPKPTDSVVKQHFIPRNGVWVSADFSAIEPTAQAELSRDPKLIEDIVAGKDEHIKYLALKERMPYEQVHHLIKEKQDSDWIEKRSKIKAFTFKRKYGGGAKSISEATGLSVDEVKDLFKEEEKAYPYLMAYQKKNRAIVESSGELQTVLGRVLKFKRGPAPKWIKDKALYMSPEQLFREYKAVFNDQGQLETYKPTEIINYPIQSTGSADLTLIMIGHFWRTYTIHNRDKYLLVNSVYDSLDIDCKPEHEIELKEHLKCLTNVKEVLYNYFKYEWIVPVKVDIKNGKSWYEAGL